LTARERELVMSGGWGCPHEVNGKCQRVRNLACNPGMKGCVLFGRFTFSDAAKNRQGAVRIDKWLWAARFFKTRSLASAAVAGGKVHVNGERAKPARSVRAGDVLRIRKDQQEFLVTVAGVSERRGSAEQARVLYEESAESIERRKLLAEQRRVAAQPQPKGRPGKRDRRRLMQASGKRGAS